MCSSLKNVVDVFVSYDSLTGPKYAEKIKKALSRRNININTFVAHLEKDNYSGNFENVIDEKISECKYFILVITFDALTRQQIIREVKTAFPNGEQSAHDFWVFHHDLETVSRSNPEFEFQTKINLEKENQHDFKDETDLATKVLIQWDHRKILEEISIEKDYEKHEIQTVYDLFGSYAQKIKYDFEHHAELNLKGERRLIDTMATADLYSNFVSQTVSYDVRQQDKKTGRYTLTRRNEDAEQYLLNFIQGKSWMCLVLGDYGSGKTSLCLNLTYRLANDYLLTTEPPIPIFVSLRNYGSNKNIHEFLSDLLQRQYNVNINTEVFIELLEQGQFVLILDGFDEMSTNAEREILVANLKQILSLYSKKSKIVLTSRTHFFRSQSSIDDLLKITKPSGSKNSSIEIVQIRPLNQEQIKEFLQKRTNEWKNQLSRINQIYNLEDLATRPLLLEMISETMSGLNSSRGNIDASDLYRFYTDLWIEHDDWRSIMKPNGKRKFMQELAEKMFLQNKNSIHYSKLSKPISEHFKRTPSYERIKDSYYYDATTCSFLNRDRNGNYSFIHKSFMEYFVADKFSTDLLNDKFQKFGKNLLTKEIRDFMSAILKHRIGQNSIYSSLDLKDSLYSILHNLILLTRTENYAETFVGSNSITLLKDLDITIKDPNLSNCSIPYADIEEMSLNGFDFSHSKMDYCKMNRCRMQRAEFNNCKLDNSQLHNAILNNSDFSNASLRNVKMTQADCSYSVFLNTDMSSSILSGTKFYRSNFRLAQLIKTDFVSSNLESADFGESNLTGADLERSNMQGSNLLNSNLEGASLVGSNVRAANMRKTNLRKIRADNIEVDVFTILKDVEIDNETFEKIPKNLRRLIERGRA